MLEQTVPTLETKRLILSAVTLSDVHAYEKHFVDYEVIRTLSHEVPWPYPENGVYTYLREAVEPHQGRDKWFWALRLKTDPQALIGVVGLWRGLGPENRGFWLGRSFWGQGLMTEAVIAVTDHAFNHFGFEVLFFTNALGNVGSRRIKEKTGATFLGIEPARFVDPTLKEQERWQMTKTDWQKR